MSIRFKNVSKAFGDKQVLRDVSFTVNTGEILFILGKSGVGKSVTLKHLVGLITPDSGEIYVNQFHVNASSEEQLRVIRKTCGMVFQHPALLDSLTIFENLAFGLRDHPQDEIEKRILECLRLVHLDPVILGKLPSEISYGMQKRVSLARTLAPGPSYLLFDEPTTGLDPITTNAVNNLIQTLSRQLQVTSIVVSHDMGCALRIADRILVLEQGKVLAVGNVPEIKSNRSPLIQDFLAEAF